MKKERYNIYGMTCSACSNAVERSVKKIEGVEEASVNLLSNLMNIKYDENKVTMQNIINSVQQAGYDAEYAEQKQQHLKQVKNKDVSLIEIQNLQKRLLISLIFMLPLLYISMGNMLGAPVPKFLSGTENVFNMAFVQLLLTVPVMIINQKFYKVGFKTLLKGSPNMDSLIAVGTSAAVVYGLFAIFKINRGYVINDLEMVKKYAHDLYFESAAVILTLITLGKYLEAKAKGKTSEAIKKLVDLAPKTAVVLIGGAEKTVPIEEVQVGYTILVKPGQKIPVDGVITRGITTVDESMLTGESIPVSKKEGDTLIGASLNKTGAVYMKAVRVGEDTTLSQIIHLVQEAQNSKAPIARLADKISAYFVPTVLSIALLSTIVWLFLEYSFSFALSIGISVLVISCPCALGLATPTAIMVGTGKGAQYGILIKDGEALETTRKINTVVLDKTGTITQGKPVVTDIVTTEELNEDELILLAASAEKNSEHPLGEAVIKEAEKRNITLMEVKSYQAIPGHGLKAVINEKELILGNVKLINDYNIYIGELKKYADRFSQEGKTPLYVADKNKVLGIIAVADILKSTSKKAIQILQNMGLEVVMLTGDNKKTAEAIKNKIGIKKVIAEVLPQDKSSKVKKLQNQGKKVAMVGDGINDAPALAVADVGIAVGSGTDVAIESADIVLMKNDLLDVATVIQLSGKTIQNIKQNLFWAFFYNILGIPIAAGVFYGIWGFKLNPMFAAAAMSFSSVTVVTNALRLRTFKPQYLNSENNIKENDIKRKDENNMKKKIYIEGMSCMHCVNHVEKALEVLEGVDKVDVNLDKNFAIIESSKEISDKDLEQAIADAGYSVSKVEMLSN